MMARKNKALKQQKRQQKKQTKQKKKQINKTYKQEKRAAKKKKKYDKKQLKQQAKAQTNYDVDAPALSDTIDSATDTIDNISTAARDIRDSKKSKKSFAEKMNHAKNVASNLLSKASKAKNWIITNNPLKKQQEINLDDMSDNSTNSGGMSTQSTSEEEEGFFSKYKIPIIIGGTLLTIGGLVFALTRSSTPPPKKGKLNGIDDDEIGDIEPIELS